jgi:hypothetical protein
MFEINENQVYQLRGNNINSPLESQMNNKFHERVLVARNLHGTA